MSVKRGVAGLAVVGAALAGLGFVFAQPSPRSPFLSPFVSYHGLRYGLESYADGSGVRPFCFVLPADVVKGGTDPLPRGYSPFRRVGAVSRWPTGSRAVLLPHYEWHLRHPDVLVVRDDDCLRRYSSVFISPAG